MPDENGNPTPQEIQDEIDKMNAEVAALEAQLQALLAAFPAQPEIRYRLMRAAQAVSGIVAWTNHIVRTLPGSLPW